MPQLSCPRCQRVNPEAASFCWFDGHMLRPAAGPAAPAVRELPREFFFASGRRCRTLDEFAVGCRDEWDDARSLLRAGHLAKYLDGIGRPDLADNARETANQPDADAALYAFLQGLPTATNHGPRLDLQPRRVVLSAVRTGDQRHAKLAVVNQGQGRLQGKLGVSEGEPWLVVGDGVKGAAIQTARTQEIGVRIDARGLTAGQSYSGKLTAITNGGIAEVPVRLDVAALPFPRAPYNGATSPRDLAERMRANPKPAIALLEGGDVARWFAANGWTYPVPGMAASGIAAVQQFFEYLGLSKPPALELSTPEVRAVCRDGATARGEVVVRAATRKWVYARAQCGAPWLRVLTPTVSGPQQVSVAFEIDADQLDRDGAVAELQLTANGGQKLTVRVVATREKSKAGRGWRLAQPLVAGAVAALLWRVLLAAPADLLARGILADGPPASLADWLRPATADSGFLRHFTLATAWLGAVIGVVAAGRRGGRWLDVPFGAVAGAAGGLAIAATLGVLVAEIDAVPRAALAWLHTNRPIGARGWPALAIWVGIAAGCWTMLGFVLGAALTVFGRFGRGFVAIAAAPLARISAACGLRRLAGLFHLE